jgi:hypothetical protein
LRAAGAAWDARRALIDFDRAANGLAVGLARLQRRHFTPV